MTEDALSKEIYNMLPPGTTAMNTGKAREAADSAAASMKRRASAQELARQKQKEKAALKRAEGRLAQREALAEELGIPLDAVPSTLSPDREQALRDKVLEQRKRLETLEAIEAIDRATPADPIGEAMKQVAEEPLRAEPLPVASPAPRRPSLTDMAALSTTTRPEVLKLLTSLNINLNLQLSKSDTSNLLACLLTCNEQQLQALMADAKVPVVIKTVIKRLLDDMRLGNIETVEKLWDRVFGKNAMSLELPSAAKLGILPDTPVSREAYIILRDTIIQ